MLHSLLSTSPAGSAWAIALWTIVIGCLCAIPASLVGSFLVLRRMSLLGDAISHAVLPGVAIAFLISGEISGVPIFIGAILTAILTAFLTRTVAASGVVNEQAGLGVVFTSLFAIGVLLISRAAQNIDLDPGCVLYGAIEFVPLETVVLGSFELPRTAIPLGFTALLTIGFILAFFKELKITSFDAPLAESMGLSPRRMDFFLLLLTSFITVLSFEAVGSILVIVLLVAPACTALHLTDRLEIALPLAVLFGCLSSVLGYSGALSTNTSVAGMIAVASGFLFLISWIFAPKHGRFANLLRRFRLRLQIATDDLLAVIYRREESGRLLMNHGESVVISNGLLGWLTKNRAVRKGWLDSEVLATESRLQLTPKGREMAQSIVRGHRLWESFLHRDFQLAQDHLHEPAEIAEHFLGPDLQRELSDQLNTPGTDPHGQSIP
ncbi:MAG: iron ABC transporter [Planctomycetota bacterium]|nr:MAG: iron ABC transporter [Planctomycetota bacterium]